MAVPDSVKRYLAEKYGDGSVTKTGMDSFTDSCMLVDLGNTGVMKTPLPTGYTETSVCHKDVIQWGYDNIGYTPPTSGVEPPESVKNYLADKYGDGGITQAGMDSFTDSCMLVDLGNTGVMKTPLPTGYTETSVCHKDVIQWGYDNIGYTATTPPPPPPPPPPPENGVYVPPELPATGKAQIRACSVPGETHVVIDGKEDPQLTYPCSDINPRWIGIDVPTGVLMQIGFQREPDFLLEDNIAKPPGGTHWGPFVDGQITYIRKALVAAPGAATGTLQLFARDVETGEYLSARPNINGIAGEEAWLMLGADGIKINLPVSTYEVTCTYPGYEQPERVSVTLTEQHIATNPYSLTFDLKPILIHKVVEVRERAAKVAWVTDFDIPGVLIHGVPFDGSIQFQFLEEASYRVFFSLHPLPAGWDQTKSVGELPPSVKSIFATIEGDYTIEREGETLQVLNPILHSGQKYRAKYESILERGANAVPPGYYVAVTTIERWVEVL